MFIEAGDVTHRRLGQNRNEDRFSKKKLKFFTPKIFLTQICLFCHNSARNDENKNFRKNQNFDPPNFWTPLIFQNFERPCYTAPLYQIWELSVQGPRS